MPIVGLIHAYRYSVGPMLGNHCRFTPSCSQFALEAIRCYGPFGGSLLTLKRLACCHPFSAKHGYDPLPARVTPKEKP